MRLSKDTKGYNRITIKLKTYKVHRLVYSCFGSISDISELSINHIDFNKTNNNISNLEAISYGDNVRHYVNGKIKNNSSSSKIGVFYHKGINKWVSRVTYSGKRYFLGSFDNEIDAINIIDKFNNTKDTSLFNIGKGKSNLGKSKYTSDDDVKALELAKKIGVRKAGIETKMGSTRISKLRREYEEIDGVFIKKNKK